MKTNLHVLDQEPKNDLYFQLLDAALPDCKRMALVVRSELAMEESALAILDKLKLFLQEVRFSDKLPVTRLMSGKAKVYQYRYVAATVDALKEISTGLYDWQQPVRPEDLSLQRMNGSYWLATAAHDSYGAFDVSIDEWQRLIQTLPDLINYIRKSDT